MDNILERMLREEKAEELARLDAIKIVNDLFSKLLDREKDVLSRRFGLKGDKAETLEKIGKMHQLTRERVRQIEAASIRKIKKIESLEDFIGHLQKTVTDLLEEHGGLLRKDYLLDILAVYSLEINNGKQDGDNNQRAAYRNSFNFLISRLLEDKFETVKDSDKFNACYKIKDKEVKHLESVADDILAKIEADNKTVSTEELVTLAKNLNSYDQHKDTIFENSDKNLTEIFKSDTFFDKGALINENKVLYALLQAIKNIDQNKYGHWGKSDWHEIKPKTINDKIYLVLKNEAKPMHFTDIAAKINDMQFDRKKANPATVHNELILDNRYVLTGRGMYALKDLEG